MKSIIFLCSFAAMTSIASTECSTPQIARDAIRAIAWDGEIREISLKTPINAETLFTHCDGLSRCEEVYKAVLKLPDLASYTSNQHVNAFYIAG